MTGLTPVSEHRLNMTLLLRAAPTSDSASSSQLCSTCHRDTSVLNGPREPLKPLSGKIQFKQFS